MTHEETIEYERLKTARDSLLLTIANLRGQLETIAAEERESCAKVADNRLLLDASSKERDAYDLARKNIAAEIRARGKQA